VLAFSDPHIMDVVSEDFVPVASDDWYLRRRDDAEGAFFRKMADQRPGGKGPGGNRQGIYCFTASGILLGYRNHQEADAIRALLRQSLAAWDRLPVREREPGAVTVPDLKKVDPRFARTPPKDGLILTVSTRILDSDDEGKLVRGSCRFTGGDQAARDHLWLTREDCRALTPEGLKKGDRLPMPPALGQRLLRYHLLDNTRGEPAFWEAAEVRKQELSWTVVESTREDLRLRLTGTALLATDADPDRARRGFDVALLGFLHYDRALKVIDRLEILAVGDHWGDGPQTPDARPGRQPLGVHAELTTRRTGADLVPPQGTYDLEDYLGRPR
jgi:hypothetical protein